MALKPVAGRPVVPKNPGTGRSLSFPSIKPISPAKPITPARRAVGAATTPGGAASGTVSARRPGTVAERPVQRPVADNPTTPVRQVKPIAKPQTPIKRRAAGQIKNPGNPIPTPRPVKPRTSTASTDPWKTGW